LTLPVLLLLVFGCVDFGRGIATYITVSNAARVGAEYGATHQFTSHTRDSWETQVKLAVSEEMQQVVDYVASDLTIGVETAGSDDNVRITVTANYPFRPLTVWPGVAQSLTFRREVTMRQFR
jgi:Flp pilus assembly protein TadG